MENTFLNLSNQNADSNVQVRKIYNLSYGNFSEQLVIGVDTITNQVGRLYLGHSNFDVTDGLAEETFYDMLQPFNVKETSFDMSANIESTISHSYERILYQTEYKGYPMESRILYFYLPEIDFYALCRVEKGVTSFGDGDGEDRVEIFSEYEVMYLTALVEKIN